MKTVKHTFSQPVEGTVVYPVEIFERDGRTLITLRSADPVQINSDACKQVASKALDETTYRDHGMESYGGAYLIERATGKAPAKQPMIKAGDAKSMAPYIYERIFRVTPKMI